MEIKEYEKIEKLTKKLVSINSINNNENKGETKVAEYIYNYFSKLSYFKKNPSHLMCFDSENKRYSTLAYLKGKGKETIIIMGHIDTVDIKDFGKASKYACDTDKIGQKLKEYFDLPKNIIEDIDSNKYLFGRGTLDMKAGVASNMVVFEYFAKNIDKLNGNLLFLAECDEEGDSKGVISALDKLIEIKNKENFKYIACINSDYSVSYDNKRYVYLGTVGKLLPSFVAIGKESHVGSPFEGFDPNLLLSILNKNISLNTSLCDKEINKSSVPPICLKQSDTKDSYTVQTASSAYSYFNYMLYNSSPKEVLNKCLKIAKDSFKETINHINEMYKLYCQNNKLIYKKINYKNNVYSFEEFDKFLKENNPNYEKEIKKYAKEIFNEKIDIREYAYKIILKAYEYSPIKEPMLIVYFGSTFYSNIVTKNKRLIKAVNKAISKINKESKYDIEISDFYPYISDMSYMECKHKTNDIDKMISNTPYYYFQYKYPYLKIKEINVPVVNIGTFGFDGHTYIERLEKNYAFNELPNLLYETIIGFFEQ